MQGINVLEEEFCQLVRAGGVLRGLALSYPDRYKAASEEFDKTALAQSREDFLDSIE
jgi:hypothetical protein